MKKPRGWKRRNFNYRNKQEAIPVQVIADAAMAHPGIVAGRFVPVLIIDTSGRPDIEEYCTIHKEYGPGDAITTWGFGLTRQYVGLKMDVIRPVETSFTLMFDSLKQTAVISMILESGSVFVQPGRPGDRFSHDLSKNKVLIEVPDTGFKDHWLKERKKIYHKRFRRAGLSRAQATLATEQALDKLSIMANFPLQGA